MEASSAAPVPTHAGAVGSSPEPRETEPAVRTRRLLGPVDIPPQRGLAGSTIAGLALAAGIAAVALGLWAFITAEREKGPVFAPPVAPATPDARTIALLSKPTTRRLSFDGSRGRLVLAVAPDGRALLVLDRLRRAPAGKAYEAFVLRPRAKAPAPAAVFSGRDTVVPLSVRVRRGSIVVVTLERAGGVRAPTQTPLYVAQLV